MIFHLQIDSREKQTEVFIHKIEDNRALVAIPEIHWSTIVELGHNENLIFNHILSSLLFQLFHGNAEFLTKEILANIKKL